MTTRPQTLGDDSQARDVVERLAAAFRQGASQRDQSRTLPAEQIEQLTQAGFFGMPAQADLHLVPAPLSNAI